MAGMDTVKCLLPGTVLLRMWNTGINLVATQTPCNTRDRSITRNLQDMSFDDILDLEADVYLLFLLSMTSAILTETPTAWEISKFLGRTRS